jgi:hypothetical protein
MGRRCLTHTSTYIPVPVFRRPCCVPMQRQLYDLQAGVVVGRPLHDSIRVHHVHANNPS